MLPSSRPANYNSVSISVSKKYLSIAVSILPKTNSNSPTSWPTSVFRNPEKNKPPNRTSPRRLCFIKPDNVTRASNRRLARCNRAGGLVRCRDESEVGFERYCALAVLGRNIHALGKLLIARADESAPAALSKRAAA